ncbi:hypothetical protein GN958_ATG11990 [Phytophthora infestans]|uniref:Uncharacterized protein n=1 Tax=Phytophthora infestans TaxID=4787 RepID=A0A8S9UDE7_PHYIN|nr:hypothetical protein GN958_ATG11990 [Phytophthora infestans]
MSLPAITTRRLPLTSEEDKPDDGLDDPMGFDTQLHGSYACREFIFSHIAPDDINVGAESETLSVSDESEEKDSAFSDFGPHLEEYVDEVESDSDSDFEDDDAAFQQADDETKGLEWKSFGQDHFGKCVVYRIRVSID